MARRKSDYVTSGRPTKQPHATPQEFPFAVGLLEDMSDRYGGHDGMMEYLLSIPRCEPSDCIFKGVSPVPS